MENNKNSQILKQLKQFFDNEEYNSAVELIKANKDKFEPGVYEYNLGVAYYKNDSLVSSRVWFEKARQEGFISNELNGALEEVTTKLEVVRLEESQSFNDSFNSFAVNIPVDAYYTVTLLFLVLLAVFYKKIDKYIKVIILVISFLPMSFYHFHVKDFNSIIVLEDQVVYRGPSAMFEQTQIIPKGMKLLTSKTHGDWRYVLTPSSHRGWFKTKKVESL